MKTKRMKKLLLLTLCALLMFSAARAEEAPRTERLPDEVLMTYYDRSLFVGDSLIVMFRNYVRETQKSDPDYFAGIKFYGAYNYQLRTAAAEKVGNGTSRVDLKYKGRSATMGQIMEAEQPARVFILAGMNERIHAHLDWAENYIDRIMALRDKYSPDTEICFFSLTPVRAKIGMTRQQKHDAYNVWLEEKCAQAGAVYIDIASGLKDEDGLMTKGISSDGEFHLNDKGNAIWAAELLDFAQSRYEAGLWTPADSTEP